MSLPFDIITFDCYGTLIDWRAGIGDAAVALGRERGFEVDPAEVLRLHAALEAECQRGPYLRYREVLKRVARDIAVRLQWDLPEDRASFLADSVPDWRPFEETNRVLERLKADGYRLGILSNADNDMLARTRQWFTVEFDLLVTAEDVGAYKPTGAHFETARRLIGGNRWLHAAQSYFHDIAPASAFGVSTVWVNRLGEEAPGGEAPGGNVRDLDGLVPWLAARPPRRARPGQSRR